MYLHTEDAGGKCRRMGAAGSLTGPFPITCHPGVIASKEQEARKRIGTTTDLGPRQFEYRAGLNHTGGQ